MRKAILLLSLLAVMFMACKNTKSEPVKPEPEEGITYIGMLSDLYIVTDTASGIADTIPYTKDSVEVSVTAEDTPGFYSILFHKVKFADNMPVTLDITIPGVAIDAEGNVTGDNIVPIAMGGEFPQFTVRGLEGICTDEALSISLKFGDYPTTYVGVKK